MRNLNLFKIANLFTLLAIVSLLLVPAFTDAQFRRPTANTEPIPNVNRASELVIRIIEILLAIAGLIAVIFLIVGGFRYVTAGGNEEASESAKKTITNAIIGIIIIILAFVIVRVIANAIIGGQAQV